MTTEEILAQVDLFSSLEKKELQALASSTQERTYAAGTVIFEQGNAGTSLFVIKDGKVEIRQANNPDRAEEVLGHAGSGAVLGEMALLDELPRSASAVAVEAVTAILLPVWEFRSILREDPELAIKLLGVLSKRLRRAEARHI